MSDMLSEQQLHWLRLLMKHRPQDEGAELVDLPADVQVVLFDRKFAHLRHGTDIEITFDGIREVRRCE